MADAGFDGVHHAVCCIHLPALLKQVLVLTQALPVRLELRRRQALRVRAEEELQQAGVPELVELARGF